MTDPTTCNPSSTHLKRFIGNGNLLHRLCVAVVVVTFHFSTTSVLPNYLLLLFLFYYFYLHSFIYYTLFTLLSSPRCRYSWCSFAPWPYLICRPVAKFSLTLQSVTLAHRHTHTHPCHGIIYALTSITLSFHSFNQLMAELTGCRAARLTGWLSQRLFSNALGESASLSVGLRNLLTFSKAIPKIQKKKQKKQINISSYAAHSGNATGG